VETLHTRLTTDIGSGIDIGGVQEDVIGNVPYHDQNAIMNPNQEKKKTRPYTLVTGLRNGMDWAFLLMGLMAGDRQRREMLAISTEN
jgi:hypothetical protein